MPRMRIRLRASVLPLVVCALVAIVSCQAAPADPQAVSLVITGGTVVTVDSAHRVFSPGAVAVNGRDIVAVDRADAIDQQFKGAQTIDASGQVVLPGLVNTHGHAPMVLYRGLADDLALMDWLQNYIFPAEARTVNPEFVRVGTRLAALEMIQSGTTTHTDMYYFEEEVARATREAGMRGVLGETILNFPSPDAKTPAEGLARAEAFIKAFRGDELIVPAVAPHAMYTVDEQWLRASRALADKYAIPVILHISETQDEVRTSLDKHGMRPVEYLESIGFWGPRTIAAHGVWLSDAEIAILKRRNVALSHNPESNMKLASGTAPILKCLNAGMIVALGTDGAASNNDLDMFEAMRQAAFLQKLQAMDPQALPATVALEMATIRAAKAVGMDREIGSLEIGKRADIITVSMKGARQTPMYNPISHLVYVSKGDDVQNTIVNGRVLMRDRKVTSLDETKVLADARAMAERVRKAVLEPRDRRH
jgi:5-methylthioadenosine/S-adenosylhomocysteine deaminase